MDFIIIILAVFGTFWSAVCIVKLCKKCDFPTALETVLNRLTGTVHISLAQDEGFWSEIWAAICNIIGDARFDKLRRTYEALASSQGGIRLSGHHSGLPYIVIIIDLLDEAERKLIEAVIVGIVKRHLRTRGLPDTVVVTWGKLSDYGLDYLEIRFGETQEESAIVRTVLANEIGQQALTNDDDF